MLLTILLLPLFGAPLSYLLGKRWAGKFLVTCFFLVFLLALWAVCCLPFGASVGMDWMTIGRHTFSLGLHYDAMAGIMTLTVSFIASLVALFSLAYMKHDHAQPRYFALLGLFACAMYGIVLSSHLVLTFIFWELVGLSSYLLIGFWFEQDAARRASFKAIMMNKVGDLGFLLAIFLLFAYTKTLDIQTLLAHGLSAFEMPSWVLTTIGIGLLLAAVGKSAQFPLHTWLPDAMTGPTPVSALIHAATMVAAGIYLLVRLFPLLSPEVLMVAQWAGGITALMGGFAALMLHDIKKILASSTLSQLGLMMMAVGAGIPTAAFFHLTTHAFFKAGLFLCAGSIIHYLHETGHSGDVQDIRHMGGGLRRALPVTFLAFTVCMASLMGLPLMSGFLSKEMILAGFSQSEHFPELLTLFGLSVIGLTALYMPRLYLKVFFQPIEKSTAYIESMSMKIPLLLLSLFSLGLIYSLHPLSPTDSWLIDMIATAAEKSEQHSIIIPLTSVVLSLVSITFSYRYAKHPSLTAAFTRIKSLGYRLASKHFYVDAFYLLFAVKGAKQTARAAYWLDRKGIDRVVNRLGELQVVLAYVLSWWDRVGIDGAVRGISRLVKWLGYSLRRSVQTGSLQGHLLWMLLGVLLMIYFFIF